MNLVLGRIPAHAVPETHVLAGAWSFVGEEARFPDGETRFTFAPDPFANTHTGSSVGAEHLEHAAHEARCLAAQSLPGLVARLRSPTLPPLPAAYWETLLLPWLLTATQQIVGYLWRARTLVDAWGTRPLRVPLLPVDTPFTFIDEHDYVFNGVLDHTYVHWLLSRLLEPLWPIAWEKAWIATRALPARNDTGVCSCHFRIRERARALATRCAQRVWSSLPFPRVKGFSVRQSLLYSLALWRNRTCDDHSRSFASCVGHAPALPPLLFDPLPLIWASLPQSIKILKHPEYIAPAKRPRVRVMGIQAYEDAVYRQKLARWRGAGHRGICIQHGGNYGHVRTSPVVPATEYAQHAFITWGWSRHGHHKGNFIPLPHAQIQALRNAHQETAPVLLYVGTEMTVFPYRMDSRPTPLEYVAYRAAKRDFFAALEDTQRGSTLYRPYFSVPGTLKDAEWLLPQFPALRLCVGPLEPQLLGCRLCVVDHHGTTLLQACAAGIPTVMYWDRRAWALCPEAEHLLDILAHAGIWYPDAVSAAQHVVRVWDSVGAWWHSPAVVEARTRWCAAYALTIPGNIDSLWQQTLRTV